LVEGAQPQIGTIRSQLHVRGATPRQCGAVLALSIPAAYAIPPKQDNYFSPHMNQQQML
jgi:hypothetical protein